jgi:type I restriction-modification system DNA methylase subunit
MFNKEEAFQKISELTERFEDQIATYKKPDYNETLIRRDYIDPFFKALGWDVDNSQGYFEAYREVIHEDRVKVSGKSKAPDYSFRLPRGKKLFFVEAKKPSVVVKDDVLPAYQVRRYGWSAKLPVSIVTDFEEFALYDCTKKPFPTDKASTARIKYFTYKDYRNEFDFFWNTFSKERVLRGGLDKFIVSDKIKKGTATVDKEFLLSLDEWRKELALNIALRNEITNDELNFVVQAFLDRLIFLRIAEDRNVEEYGSLKNCIISIGGEKNIAYSRLLKLFAEADSKYNSGIFDFKADKISKRLEVDNPTLRKIIQHLYYPDSPYEFSQISVEILGNTYEQFLGKQIILKSAHRATIEEKPEVRKAGGVYYTPQYIVDYIVENTVGELLKNKTPEEASKLKIVDPACGSGSFLLGAFDKLLKWHTGYYMPEFKRLTEVAGSNEYNTKQRNDAVKARQKLPLTPDGNLTTAIKKQILLNNIYGVDIDLNAVEVTKLSLLLKCMEGETQSSINAQLHFGERILPSLENNIRCGNSLIDVDFYESFPDADTHAIKPFSWKDAFPAIFKNGGFDVVIGNPPYVRQELLSNVKPYFQEKYKVYHGVADLYTYFFERGIELLNNTGVFGIIVANKWMRANYGEPLRKWFKQQDIKQIIDFGDLPVFENATTYPCIILAQKGHQAGIEPNPKMEVVNVKTLQFESLKKYVDEEKQSLQQTSLENGGWNLGSDAEQALLKKLQQAGIPLEKYVEGKIYYGIKTGLNEAFVINETTKEFLIKEDKRSVEIIKPFLAGRDIKRYQTPCEGKYLILFPKGFTNKKGNNPKNAWKWLIENYNAIAKHSERFKEAGEKRFDKGEYWWELRACDYYGEFEKPKIIIPAIVKEGSYAFDTNNFYSNDKTSIIPTDDLFLLGIINSKACDYFLKSIASTKRGGYFEYKPMYISKLPIQK